MTAKQYAKTNKGLRATIDDNIGRVVGYCTPNQVLIKVDKATINSFTSYDNGWGNGVNVLEHWSGRQEVQWVNLEDIISIDNHIMPEIKVGMVVEIARCYDAKNSKYLVMGDWAFNIEGKTFSSDYADLGEILAVYEFEKCPFNDIEDNLTLLWKKESALDIEIRELETKLEELKKQREVEK